MKPYFRFLISILVLAVSVASGATPVADKPPVNIIEHYHWCLAPKSRPDSIQRLEGFWQKYHPENEEYGDAIDVRFVHLCGYCLVKLYFADGKTEKALTMLRWLEANDYYVR